MIQLSDILEKVSAKRKAKEESEGVLRDFSSKMLLLLRDEMATKNCIIKASMPSFYNEGRNLSVTVVTSFPNDISTESVDIDLTIQKLEDVFYLSSGSVGGQEIIETPEQAVQLFLNILYKFV